MISGYYFVLFIMVHTVYLPLNGGQPSVSNSLSITETSYSHDNCLKIGEMAVKQASHKAYNLGEDSVKVTYECKKVSIHETIKDGWR